MNKTINALLMFAVSLILAGSAAAGHGRHGRGMSVSIHNQTELKTCADLDVTFDGELAVRAEERLSFSVSSAPLHVRGSKNGGVHVLGGEGKDFSVLACKAAPDGPEAEEVLRQIRLKQLAGQLTVEGPLGDDWAGFLIVRAPKNSALEAEATNGPISVHDFAGTFAARTTNGPISAKQFSGKLEARVQNGPIDIEDASGDLNLEAQNGPISVRLAGSNWQGRGLDARTQNGPVSLRLPAGYRSGVLVEASGHSPMSCEDDVCAEAQRTWDNRARRIQFGGDPVVVRLSTVNGPVTVGSGKRRSRKRGWL